MSWDRTRALARIKKHLTTVPTVAAGVTLANHEANLRAARKRGDFSALSTRKTFQVEGAHLYGQLLGFDELVREQGRETEASHARMLEIVHALYRIWDAVVDDENEYRIDYHGVRMHAIIAHPEGDAAGQVERAVALAGKLSEAARQVGAAFGVAARIRFGIDQGRCLAMTTGRSFERDTLFLGAPANYAAKQAAGDAPGVYLAEGALRAVGSAALAKSTSEATVLTDAYIRAAASRHRFDRIDKALGSVMEERRKSPGAVVFRFRRHTPPLSRLSFADLSPANSVRMGIASLFADIDGYTAFVDAAIRGGQAQIAAAVKTVHVVREELNDVLQADFGGKRVRFIGDCLYGCIAAGDRVDVPADAVAEAVLCASAMYESFGLCLKETQPGVNLDLAIGIEYGSVPLTRLGMSGDDSVRCAIGRAVVEAERLQQSIRGGGVKVGPVALSQATAVIRKYYGEVGRILGYASASDLLGTVSSPAVQIVRSDPTARPHVR
jgi:hypothetical protein